MTSDEKTKWNRFAKGNPQLKHGKLAEKLTCHGVPLSQIERVRREEENVKRSMEMHIDEIVNHSIAKNGKISLILNIFLGFSNIT